MFMNKKADKRLKKFLSILLLGMTIFLLSPRLVLASEDFVSDKPRTITNIGGLLIKWGGEITVDGVVEDRVHPAIDFFVYFSALVAVGLIVAAGYMFITSAGDPEKVQKAQKALTAAIVGMVIVFVARILIGFVINVALGG
jgi:hypothetical protein